MNDAPAGLAELHEVLRVAFGGPLVAQRRQDYRLNDRLDIVAARVAEAEPLP